MSDGDEHADQNSNGSHLEAYVDIADLRVDEPPLVDVDSLDYRTLGVYERQERFLKAFVKPGTILKAAEAAGIDRDCVYIWRKRDYLAFNERFARAKQAHCDHLENMVMDRLENPTGNRGSDVLLMGKLNAEHPEKWNRNLKLTHEVPNELIQQMRALQALGNKPLGSAEPTEDKVVDAESRVMPWD